MRKHKNGPLNLREFSDVLRDFMSEEIAEARRTGGVMTTYQKICEDALQKRYASRLARMKDQERLATQTIATRANLEDDTSFLGQLG